MVVESSDVEFSGKIDYFHVENVSSVGRSNIYVASLASIGVITFYYLKISTNFN